MPIRNNNKEVGAGGQAQELLFVPASGRTNGVAAELIDGDVLECLKRELEKTEERARGLRAAIAGYERAVEGPPPQHPTGPPESRRFLRRNGKPMRPIEAMETLLPKHQGQMNTKELYDLLESGGAFTGKGNPESAFKLSIQINVEGERISQVDASGKELSRQEIKKLELRSSLFPGMTKMKTPS
jgi:hypothetical protein